MYVINRKSFKFVHFHGVLQVKRGRRVVDSLRFIDEADNMAESILVEAFPSVDPLLIDQVACYNEVVDLVKQEAARC